MVKVEVCCDLLAGIEYETPIVFEYWSEGSRSSYLPVRGVAQMANQISAIREMCSESTKLSEFHSDFAILRGTTQDSNPDPSRMYSGRVGLLGSYPIWTLPLGHLFTASMMFLGVTMISTRG